MSVTQRVVTLTEATHEAIALQNAGRLAEAKDIYLAVLAKQPANALALHQLGVIAMDIGDYADAIARLNQAIEANPTFVAAYSNLGTVLLDHGEPERAANAFRTALTLDPNLTTAHRNLLQCLLYLPGLSPERRFAEHLAFGAHYDVPPDGVLAPPSNDRDPDRRLRIGIVSSDFRSHPAAQNLLSMVTHRDPAALAVTCYAHITRSDDYTALFKAHCDGWRDITNYSDRQAAELVRADGIDLLLSVAGRFDRNRPLIAVYRPAPIQVSYGECATSGLAANDYWLSDPVVSPPEDTERFTEAVVRVPLVQNYPAPRSSKLPNIGPLPALSNGFVTYGSLNRPSKISLPTLDLWAELLRAMPTARLALKYRNHFADPLLRGRFRTEFGARGVSPDRLVFLAAETPYIEAYHAIDIGLDPFPFTGVTTTFDSLCMGVPVIALAGNTAVWRMSETLLRAAGLGAMVGPSAAAFVEIAAGLAGDLDRLVRLRTGLRAQVAASPLCDDVTFARSIETLWRALWRKWCATPAA